MLIRASGSLDSDVTHPISAMDDPTIERQLANVPLVGAPAELRGAVLTSVHRQLAAQRWDRRMGRAAVAALVVGVGLNAVVGWRGSPPVANQIVVEAKPDAITQAAVAMAKLTDAETGGQFARHLAALAGTTLSRDQEAAIEHEIKSSSHIAAGRRKDG
jgi:hypothetical protein